MRLESGQILTLNMKVNKSGTVLYGHPYLVLFVNDDYIEVAQMDSLEGKEYKASKKSNKIIYCDMPEENVIDKDSYIQLDNQLRIENFDDLTLMRRQPDKLSQDKFNEVLESYTSYQRNNEVIDDKKVYLTKEDIIGINSKLRYN